MQKWKVVEQLAQMYLAQPIDSPKAIYEKLATACLWQDKGIAALGWLKKAGLDEQTQQRWVSQYDSDRHTHTSSSSIARLAVLPFQDFTYQPDHNFSLGLLEDITSQLSCYSSIEVASSYSVIRYQGVQKAISEIAFELNVNYLLIGSVYAEGGHIKINLQCIEASRDRILWSATVAHASHDMFALRQEVITHVLEGLQHCLGFEKPLQDTYVPTPEAYDRFLQAWSVYLQAKPDSTQTAIHLFEKAIAADPSFHRAYLGLSFALASSASWWGDQTIMQVLPRFNTAIEIAAEDEQLKYEVFNLKGWVAMWMWDLKGAEEMFRRALTPNGNVAFLRLGLAHTLNMQGRHEEAQQVARQAVVKDPGHIQHFIVLAESLLLMQRFEECEQICRSALIAQPDYHTGLTIHVWALISLGRSEEAIRLAEESLARTGKRTYFVVGRLAQAYLASGKLESAEHLLQEMVARARQGEKGFPYFIALYYQQIGASEKALDWLENYLKDRFTDYLWLNVQPEFKPLHQHEQFRKLLQAVFGSE